MGFAIVDLATLEMVTTRIYNAGSSTRRAVVTVSGQDVARQDTLAPDVSFVHANWIPVNRLAPGSYLLIGFGSDGEPRNPNPFWGAEFHASDPINCKAVGVGEIFDIDHAAMKSGTQATATIAGVASGIHASFTTARRLTFGLMDVAQQGSGEATLTYTTPTDAGTLSNEIVPFIAGPGAFDFSADFAGLAPLVEIAGVSFDL